MSVCLTDVKPVCVLSEGLLSLLEELQTLSTAVLNSSEEEEEDEEEEGLQTVVKSNHRKDC